MRSTPSRPSFLTRFRWPWLSVWTLFILGLVGLLFRQDHREHRIAALAEAKALYQKDLVFRLWNSEQGGIYVPVTAKVQPNPYLAHVPGRDVATTSGLALTLVNPAYMTRMVHELGAAELGMKGHITSLKPIRPANAPDAWERGILARFDQGVREVDELVALDGQPYLRYMGALVTQERCLKCHAFQGYKVGDIRGGISVSVPLTGLAPLEILRRHGLLVAALGLVWAAGLAALVSLFSQTRLAQLAREREDNLEAQLHQSQKLEAVGQLAGGVAHDLNNMLTVILGHMGMLKDQLDPGDPRLRHLLETEKAAARSQNIVAQLLAFSRQSVLNPVTLDLADHIQGLMKTISPLIGEHIQLAIVSAPGLWTIRFDPAQLDQVVLNLVVNARDAMPGGGEVTLSMTNVQLDENFTAKHLEATAGPHVLLTVHDQGCGMTPETAARVFEPFFTTKGPGQGTGLGLSTVFGIVRQAKGFITVYSELGLGTVFKIYLPAAQGAAAEPAGPALPLPPLGARKVLLVEDDEALRSVIALMLETLGQDVRVAASGHEALGLLRSEAADAQVLLTDLVMPGMSGLELRHEALRLRPGLQVILMSGYASEVANREGLTAATGPFLQKPFTSAILAQELASLDATRNAPPPPIIPRQEQIP